MTRTLDPHLEALLQHVLRIGSLAEEILQTALDALEQGDAELAAEVRVTQSSFICNRRPFPSSL